MEGIWVVRIWSESLGFLEKIYCLLELVLFYFSWLITQRLKYPTLPPQQVIIFLAKWGSCLCKNLCVLYLQALRFSFTGRIWFVEDIISPFKENVCCKREFLCCLSLPHLHLPILSELKSHIADKVPNTDKQGSAWSRFWTEPRRCKFRSRYFVVVVWYSVDLIKCQNALYWVGLVSSGCVFFWFGILSTIFLTD